MKKKALIVVLIIILLLAGAAGAYIFLMPSPKANPTQNTGQNTEQTADKGKYIEYSESNLKKVGGKAALLFCSGWDPQCRNITNEIRSANLPKELTILKVNYDSADDLKMQYQVTSRATVVEVDKDGNQIKKFSIYYSPTLETLLKRLGIKQKTT